MVRHRPGRGRRITSEDNLDCEDDLEDAEQDEEPDRPGNDDEQSDDDSESADMPPPDSTRPRTRSNTTLEDWRAVYRENDQRIYPRSQQLSTTTATVSDLRWAPKRFAQIKNIEDTETRGAWIEAHYKENDGLFDKPDVLRMTPLPGHINAKGHLHLHTIYAVKSDGRKKARTVLGAGKDKLDTLDLGYERSFSPTARNVTVRLHCATCVRTQQPATSSSVEATSLKPSAKVTGPTTSRRSMRKCQTDTTSTTKVYSTAARWATSKATRLRDATGT